jgi:hypothetical protein
VNGFSRLIKNYRLQILFFICNLHLRNKSAGARTLLSAQRAGDETAFQIRPIKRHFRASRSGEQECPRSVLSTNILADRADLAD